MGSRCAGMPTPTLGSTHRSGARSVTPAFQLVNRCCPGVRLHHSSSLRFVSQSCADDLVILADSAADLQLGFDAVSNWGRK